MPGSDHLSTPCNSSSWPWSAFFGTIQNRTAQIFLGRAALVLLEALLLALEDLCVVLLALEVLRIRFLAMEDLLAGPSCPGGSSFFAFLP